METYYLCLKTDARTAYMVHCSKSRALLKFVETIIIIGTLYQEFVFLE